jgi:hypothetical protein
MTYKQKANLSAVPTLGLDSLLTPNCTLLLNIATYPDKFNLRKIRKATGYLAKYIPHHQGSGLESQIVIIFLDIIRETMLTIVVKDPR